MAEEDSSVRSRFSLSRSERVSEDEREMIKAGLGAVLRNKSSNNLFDNNRLETIPSEGKDEDLTAIIAGDRFMKKKATTIYSSEQQGKKEFTFIEYCPEVFHSIRRACNVDESVYVKAVAGEDAFVVFKSNSKSGQFFFSTGDARFVVKTIAKSEYKIFRRILVQYYSHLMKFKESLIVRILGLYRLKTKYPSRNLYFIVMKNVCEDEINHTIQKKFDLKGSTLGRIASVEERRKKCPVLKDQDFSNYLLSLGNKSEPFLKQLRIDTDFLASIGLMDYSVFLGVHFIDQCQNSHEEFYKRNSSRFSPSVSIDPIQHIKYGNAIYHIGIIDIFTSYNAKKRIETFVKSILHKKEEISSIDPEHYSNRLFDFIKNHMYD